MSNNVFAALATAVLLAGCASTPPSHMGIRFEDLTEALAGPADRPEEEAASEQGDTGLAGASTEPQTRRLRALPSSTTPAIDHSAPDRGPVLDGVMTVSWPQRIPDFIDVVFGEVLGVSFSYGPEVSDREELVNFSVTRPVTSRELLDSVRVILRDYGLAVVEAQGQYRVVENDQFWQTAPAFVVSRSSEDTPAELRPVVQVVPLRSLDSNSAVSFIQESFDGDDEITITAAQRDNTVIVRGLPEQVRSAVAILSSLDQPRFADAVIHSFSPRFWMATELRSAMSNALQAEGLQASTQVSARRPITLLAIENSNEVIIFAETTELANRALFWARHLDAGAQIGDEAQIFIYEVRNTDAANVAQVVNAVYGGPAPGRETPSASTTDTDAALTGLTSTGASSSARVVVDPYTNQLLFEGTAAEWERLLPLFARLDRQTPEVLIEVIVAEITLTDETSSGVEWLFSNLEFDANNTSSVGTLGGLGVQSGGLSVNLQGNNARAVISALNKSSNVNILATPRLAARSGGEASIEVGREVPVITQQSSSQVQQTPGQTDIIQQVNMRQTGNLLSIRPVVYGRGRVDLDVSLEVSEAQDSTNQSLPTPTILRRAVDTQLSLEDGAAAVIGGIIQQNNNIGASGVPVLADVPGLGRLFRTDSVESTRTELLLLVRPYLVNTADDRRELVNVLRQSFLGGEGQIAAER